ncbi:MAG: septum formation initiator family protein [Candidatus Komeilibacteria bacterium]|nr:septum formation initiator family protein [Candidatus Komeilibacteria bacterium]
MALVGYRLIGEWGKRRETEDEIARLKEEAKRLENRNLEILELSKQLTEEEFLEREARLKLGMQKPGESVAVLSREGLAVTGVSKKEAEGSRGGNAKRWWFYFFDQEKLKALREERKAKMGPQAQF